jgi:hypothetical protein
MGLTCLTRRCVLGSVDQTGARGQNAPGRSVLAYGVDIRFRPQWEHIEPGA